MARTDGRIHLAASLGGHLELLTVLGASLSEHERVWVTAAGPGADPLRKSGDRVLDVPRFSRARPMSALRNVFGSVRMAFRERPRVVVTTGAGSIVAFCVAARLLGAKVVFIETMARVTSPSASGRVLSRIAARVLVQWPELERVYPGAIVCRPALWEDLNAGGTPPGGGGTFVSVGTHRHPFDRLLVLVDRAVAEGVLPEPVIAQSGSSRYRPERFDAKPLLTQGEVASALARSEFVVCHAGSGIISAALRAGRKPLVLARRRSQSEHVDDHQQQIVSKLSELDLVVPLDGRITEAELEAAARGVKLPALLPGGPSMTEVLARELEDLAPAQGARAAHAA